MKLTLLILIIGAILISCNDDTTGPPSDELTYDTLTIPFGEATAFLRITEVLPNPAEDEKQESFKVKYFGTDTLDLAGWTVADGQEATWALSGNITYGQEITVISDKNSPQLLNGGEIVRLLNPADHQVQSFSYGEAGNGEWMKAPLGTKVALTKKGGKIIQAFIYN